MPDLKINTRLIRELFCTQCERSIATQVDPLDWFEAVPDGWFLVRGPATVKRRQSMDFTPNAAFCSRSCLQDWLVNADG